MSGWDGTTNDTSVDTGTSTTDDESNTEPEDYGS